jgi:protein-S-isoprenylcysteine O-methyltransferase Ste14
MSGIAERPADGCFVERTREPDRGISWLKLREWTGIARFLGAGVSLTYIAWILWETRTSLRDAKHESVRSDRWTGEVYALAQGGTALTALFFESDWQLQTRACMIGGVFLFGCGVVLRVLAVRELGEFYSHRVHVTDGHRIVQTGPYKFLRHPAYAGMLLARSGFVSVYFNLVSFALLIGALLPAIVLRIRVEELALAILPEYSGFSRRRARLVPLIW